MSLSATATPRSASPDYELYLLKDFRLQCGAVLPQAKLAYKTYGTLNHDRSNAILYPTSFGAHHCDIDWLIGPGQILDSSKYFIVIPNMFGNGLSSSPSNHEERDGLEYSSPFTHVDNINAQQQLLNEVFGIERLALIYGWSMGAQQAYHWGAIFPDSVERIVAVCGTAKTTPHNVVFLEGLRSVLTADASWDGQRFLARPERAIKAFARIYAGWALSQAFYREHRYQGLSYSSLEDFLVRDWEASFLRRDPANLLSMISTWINCDISNNDVHQGNLPAAYAAITAKTLVMPGETDLYFTPEDCLIEARQIPNSVYLPIPSIWGHRAGNPARNPTDQEFIKVAIAKHLAS